VKFLLDAHLPPVLARVMSREGYEVNHVFDLIMSDAEDAYIWQYAGKNGYVLISKDEDFVGCFESTNPCPQFIWIRIGNSKNRELISIILEKLPIAIELLRTGNSVVEISKG
jgi:predicted nuclease of predicted toxin-antitoxin system